jgi:uncharacterized YigZ family protein
MESSEKIFVIAEPSNNKVKIKGSQFLGFAYLVDKFEDAEEKLKLLKKEFYDATHHCYAIKLNDRKEKYSDDGEPNGTAGIRILNSINHLNLTNILVVVVRYFGGTKLGVGPLGKAYSDTSLELLENTKIEELTKFEKVRIIYEYDFSSAVHYLIAKFNCQNISNSYDKQPIIDCLIEPYLFDNFSDEVYEKTNAKVTLFRLNQVIYLRLNKK